MMMTTAMMMMIKYVRRVMPEVWPIKMTNRFTVPLGGEARN